MENFYSKCQVLPKQDLFVTKKICDRLCSLKTTSVGGMTERHQNETPSGPAWDDLLSPRVTHTGGRIVPITTGEASVCGQGTVWSTTNQRCEVDLDSVCKDTTSIDRDAVRCLSSI